MIFNKKTNNQEQFTAKYRAIYKNLHTNDITTMDVVGFPIMDFAQETSDGVFEVYQLVKVVSLDKVK